ncbi:MAG: winged helix-turn-helix domain-containing protein, partial [Acidobacteria bacterium]|nr:winged helix-turn-helix domain-containing protein [Acidobacteriota bacterium]
MRLVQFGLPWPFANAAATGLLLPDRLPAVLALTLVTPAGRIARLILGHRSRPDPEDNPKRIGNLSKQGVFGSMPLLGTHGSIALGEFSLEPSTRTLRRGGERVALTRRPFQVLVFLVEHADRVVTREELFEEFWDGHDVYDEALSKSIGAIRKAFGDSADSPRF